MCTSLRPLYILYVACTDGRLGRLNTAGATLENVTGKGEDKVDASDPDAYHNLLSLIILDPEYAGCIHAHAAILDLPA